MAFPEVNSSLSPLLRRSAALRTNCLDEARKDLEAAITAFELCLDHAQKVELRKLQALNPDNLAQNHLDFIASLDDKYRDKCGSKKKFEARLRRVIEMILLFSGVIDTVVGAAQNHIASGVWGGVKFMLQVGFTWWPIRNTN